jgi:hypothetical protein
MLCVTHGSVGQDDAFAAVLYTLMKASLLFSVHLSRLRGDSDSRRNSMVDLEPLCREAAASQTILLTGHAPSAFDKGLLR